jgi:predicted ATPase
MQITRLTVNNLRAVTHRDIDLSVAGGEPRRRVILLGANGSGKTTIVDAFTHAFQALDPKGGDFGARALGAGDVRSARSADADIDAAHPQRGSITMEAMLSDGERRAIRGYFADAPARGTLGFQIGGGEISELLGKTGVFLSDGNTSFREAAGAALLEGRPPCLLLPADRGVLHEQEDLSIKQLTDFDPRRDCLARDRRRFALVPPALALAFRGGRRNDRIEMIARMWKVLMKYFPDMPRPVEVDGLLLRFENGDGSIVPLNALSDGERAILLIFGEIALRPPQDGVVLIDEVEQHLHPKWQRAILEGLVALLPSAQFILTTQSPYVAASAPDDVVEVGDWKRHGE